MASSNNPCVSPRVRDVIHCAAMAQFVLVFVFVLVLISFREEAPYWYLLTLLPSARIALVGLRQSGNRLASHPSTGARL